MSKPFLWTQKSIWKHEFDCHLDKTLIARLKVPSWFSFNGIADSPNGNFAFNFSMFTLKSEMLDHATDSIEAEYQASFFSKPRIKLKSGEIYTIHRKGILSYLWELKDNKGITVIEMRNEGFLKTNTEVHFKSQEVPKEKLLNLMIFMIYIHSIRQRTQQYSSG